MNYCLTLLTTDKPQNPITERVLAVGIPGDFEKLKSLPSIIKDLQSIYQDSQFRDSFSQTKILFSPQSFIYDLDMSSFRNTIR